jgi:hypothetical protein
VSEIGKHLETSTAGKMGSLKVTEKVRITSEFASGLELEKSRSYSIGGKMSDS